MSETHEHLEHIEHAQHAAHSPFDRNVAMTIAIVAAALACVTMLSHRAHNETLQRQTEANRWQTMANIYHTKASDQWGYYQAKNIRKHQYEAYLNQFAALAKAADSDSKRAEVEK